MSVSIQHNPALRVVNLLAALAHAELPLPSANGRTELSSSSARALRILIDLIYRLSAVSPTGAFATEGCRVSLKCYKRPSPDILTRDISVRNQRP